MSRALIDDQECSPATSGRRATVGGAALYLLAQVGFRLRTIGRVFRRRTLGAVVLLGNIPAAVAIPALAAVALVTFVCLLVDLQAIGRREQRNPPMA